MAEIHQTVFHDRHIALKANMVDFAGWHMPLHYAPGIMSEHLATRKHAGLFDVSHMGRFVFRGNNALSFLQHVLTNNAAALDVGQAQYTIIPDDTGGAIDDAYLYRFYKDEYILVVNASNMQKDWDHFKNILKEFSDVDMTNQSEELAMVSIQGPESKAILADIVDNPALLPEPLRNSLSIASIKGAKVLVARTGYTGEPICFELFIPINTSSGFRPSLQGELKGEGSIKRNDALMVWDMLIEKGAAPVGLGARDTLRLEAGLPLYGHELGKDPEGKDIRVFSCPLAKFAVSFSAIKGEFIGRKPLLKQFEALKKIQERDYSLINDLPRIAKPIVLIEKGVARAGYKVFYKNRLAGYITSGTAVPYYDFKGRSISSKITDEKEIRSVCLALVDSNLNDEDIVEIEIRDKRIKGIIVPYHLRAETPPYARPVPQERVFKKEEFVSVSQDYSKKTLTLLNRAIENTIWRQQECINLIPSEQTQSHMTRMLSIMDPAFRYAEHRSVKAFYDEEVFYYQGCDFIGEVEDLLEKELCKYLGCREVETRLISGQMANMAVYSSIVDYINRTDRRREQRRLRRVFNNHIIRGGHLSGQPTGALQDFVARDPKTEKPAVTNFPVLAENPYKIDVKACKELLAEHKPELIIFGKSMVLHPEPVREIRSFVDEQSIKCFIMYDMAHVLGLVGAHFQEPFKDGADIVTGSTHKTFFGTQRGIVAGNWERQSSGYDFWEAVKRRAFPGYVSNHHLGTLLGLLMAAYEMNCFRDEYQKKVISNAKAFAKALKDCGLNVAGDPKVSYTETHQVIVNVGYAKGPEIAGRLEENNIVVNYQATPDEEGFTASGALRLGVSEMTRFGFGEKEFRSAAQFIRDVVIDGKPVKEEVKSFRKNFIEPGFCFSGKEFDAVLEKLHKLM